MAVVSRLAGPTPPSRATMRRPLSGCRIAEIITSLRRLEMTSQAVLGRLSLSPTKGARRRTAALLTRPTTLDAVVASQIAGWPKARPLVRPLATFARPMATPLGTT